MNDFWKSLLSCEISFHKLTVPHVEYNQFIFKSLKPLKDIQ